MGPLSRPESESGGHDTVADESAAAPELASAPTLDGPPSPAEAVAQAATSTPAPTLEFPLIGRTLGGKFQVKGVIGRGGLGTVYRGIQHPIGREVAIKVINRQRALDPALRQRFKREAAAAALLKHPGIIALYDFGEDGGELYMVMELVEGRELRDLLRERKRLEPEAAVGLTRQICEGLAHAHERGLVHRDLKPENIMISDTSVGTLRAQILDFGIVKAVSGEALELPMATPTGHETRAGVIMGTPAYLAPEQAYARGVGPATDQYSLAVMLYEMLTGQLPFHKGSEFEVMTAHCVAPFPPMPAAAEVPAALEEVVRRAMEKEQKDRFPTILTFSDALVAALQGAAPEGGRVTAIDAARGATPEPLVSSPSRPWVPALGMGLAIAAVAGGYFWLRPKADPASGHSEGRTEVVLVATPPNSDPASSNWQGTFPFGLRMVIKAAPRTESPPTAAPPTAALPSAAPPTAAPTDAPPSDAPPSAAPPSVATEGPRPQAPATDKSPKVRVTKLVADCETELAAIKQGSRNQSLSKGSGLCTRVAHLGARVRSGQCSTPIPGIDKLLNLCGE